LQAASELDGLPGVGPGLAWALARAGLVRRADLAALEAAELAARLGPLGRLVPAEAWIAAARAEGAAR
jgi:predicted flap endonuclease-1-like 5' DNA nuclease